MEQLNAEESAGDATTQFDVMLSAPQLPAAGVPAVLPAQSPPGQVWPPALAAAPVNGYPAVQLTTPPASLWDAPPAPSALSAPTAPSAPLGGDPRSPIPMMVLPHQAWNAPIKSASASMYPDDPQSAPRGWIYSIGSASQG